MSKKKPSLSSFSKCYLYKSGTIIGLLLTLTNDHIYIQHPILISLLPFQRPPPQAFRAEGGKGLMKIRFRAHGSREA